MSLHNIIAQVDALQEDCKNIIQALMFLIFLITTIITISYYILDELSFFLDYNH